MGEEMSSLSLTLKEKCSPNATEKAIFIAIAIVAQLGYFESSSVITLAGMVFAFIFSFFLNEIDQIALLAFLLPLNRVMTVGPISVLSLILIAYFLKMTIARERRMAKALILLSLVLVVPFIIQAIFYQTLSPLFDWMKIALMVLVFDDMICSTKRKANALDVIHLIVAYLAAGIIISTLIDIALEPSTIVSGKRFTLGDEGGQNVLAISCSFASISLILHYMRGNAGRTIWLVPSLVLIGVLTGSRSFVLSFAIGFALLLIDGILGLRKEAFLKIFLAIAALLALSYFAIVFIPETGEYIQMVALRIMKPKNGDISNDRFRIWSEYYSILIKNPTVLLFGVPSISLIGFDIVAHNFIIEQIVDCGLVANIVMLPVVVCLIRDAGINVSGTRLLFSTGLLAPVILIIASALFSHSLLGIPQFFMLSIGVFQASCMGR